MKRIDSLSQPGVLGDNGGPVVVGFIIVALKCDSNFETYRPQCLQELRYLNRCECLFSALHTAHLLHMVGRFSSYRPIGTARYRSGS